MTAKAVNRQIGLACRRKQNYIIDQVSSDFLIAMFLIFIQTNTSVHARRRKLMPFRDFRRVCAVIVPTDDQFAVRRLRQEQETGVSVPPEAMLELKGSSRTFCFT
jgi:hypothetical protein